MNLYFTITVTQAMGLPSSFKQVNFASISLPFSNISIHFISVIT